MDRILYVTSHWPGARSYGAQQRVLHIGRLLNRFGRVGLVVVSSDEAEPEARARTEEEFEVLRVVRAQRVDTGGWKGRLRHELDPAYLQTDPWAAEPSEQREVRKLMENCDVVWVHTVKTANMLRIYRWPRSVLDIDDIPSHLYGQAAASGGSWSRRLFNRRMEAIWRRREGHLAERFDVLGVCSDDDRRYVGNGNVVVIPNGYPMRDAVLRKPADPPRVGFVGTLRWEPNVDGVKWFIGRVWPRVRQRVPEAQLRLAGLGSEEFSDAAQNVFGLGFIEDLADEISTWSLMTVPIRMGGGTRIKIAEAFASKCPVVSTSLGAYGYDVQDRDHLLLADDPRRFADACAHLLCSPQEGEQMALSAHELYRRRWTWESYAPKVSQALDAVAEVVDGHSARPIVSYAKSDSKGQAGQAGTEARLQDSVVSGIAWSGVETWVRPVLALVVYSMLARLVGPESFGLLALGLVYIVFIELAVTQAFTTTLVQRQRLEREHLDSAFLISFLTASSFWFLSVVFADFAATILREPGFSFVLPWLSVYGLFSAVGIVPFSILKREMAFRSLAFRNLGAATVGGAVGVTMAIFGWGVWSLVGQQLSMGLTRAVLLWGAVSWRPRIRISARHTRDLFRFGGSVSANNLLYFFVQKTDHSLVGYSFGAVVLGPYSLASRVVQIMSDAVAGSFEAVALPTFSRLQSEGDRLRQAFYKFTEIQAIIAFPAFAGMIALAPLIVPLVFGERWFASIPILQALALYGAVRVAMTFAHPLMLAVGRPGLYLALYVLNAVGALLFCLIAVQFGARAVAWAVVLNVATHSTVVLIVGRKFFNPIQFLRRLVVPGIATGIMLILVVFLRNQLSNSYGPVATMAFTVAAGTVIYALAISLLSRETVVDAYHLLRRRRQSEG